MAARSGGDAVSRARVAPPPAKDAIRDRALAAGFDAVGFAPCDLGRQTRENLLEFLSRGYSGDMGWLAATAERRAAPTALWPEAKSVVVVAVNYGPASDPLNILDRPDRGAISVYARGGDYHDVLKKRLRALAKWIHREHACEVKLFVDTAPVMEKPLAARAGLGWQGKHTNLVSRAYGSWLFLGEIYTSLELAPDDPHHDRCGACRRCLDACPTNAFPAPYQLDARRCISYLTIEHKGHIPAEFRVAMGNRIYGCDDCLAVCPWNKFARRGETARLAARAELDVPELRDLAELDERSFRDVFAASPIKRTGRDRFVRNVLIAIGNSGDKALAPTAERLLGDASPLVRAMAVWALGRLLDADAFTALRRRRLGEECDAAVRSEWGEPDPR